MTLSSRRFALAFLVGGLCGAAVFVVGMVAFTWGGDEQQARIAAELRERQAESQRRAAEAARREAESRRTETEQERRAIEEAKRRAEDKAEFDRRMARADWAIGQRRTDLARLQLAKLDAIRRKMNQRPQKEIDRLERQVDDREWAIHDAFLYLEGKWIYAPLLGLAGPPFPAQKK
jgi:hypothetical protein